MGRFPRQGSEDWRPVETDEIRALKLREALGSVVPHLINHIANDLCDFAMREKKVPPGEETTFAEDADFLRDLDRDALEERTLRELKEGDGTLAKAFLTFAVLRLGLAEGRGKASSDLGEALAGHVRSERAGLEEILSDLLRRQSDFQPAHGPDDLKKWIGDRAGALETIGERNKKLGRKLSPRLFEEYKLFDRILSENFQEADREKLRSVIDSTLRGDLPLVEHHFVYVLEGKAGSREALAQDVSGLIKLYRAREFVDDVIPIA